MLNLLMGSIGISFFGNLICCLGSGRWLLNGETDIISALASFNTMSVQAGGIWTAPKTLSTYWDALVTVLSWNYPFLDSPWLILLKIFLWLVSCGVAWGIIEVFVWIISGIIQAARNLIP
jgi:hypothetical protein